MKTQSIWEKLNNMKVSCRFPIAPDQKLKFGDVLVRRNSNYMIVIQDLKEFDQVMVIERAGNVYTRERKNIWFSTSLKNLTNYEF